MDKGYDLRDLFRPEGGKSRMTWRWLATFIDGLPPESRTKTAIRDDLDPFELAAMSNAPRKGWGPHSRADEIAMQTGERLDWILYAIAKACGGNPKDPAPWRRPGVLGAQELAAKKAKLSAPVIDQLEAERAERDRARAEAAAAAGKR